MFISAVVTTAMLFAFLPARIAYAATYVVNSTADTTQCDGNTCTLRGALIQAGLSAGVDTITFSIGTGGGITPPVIQPASQLPSIQDGVVIDGTTQSQGQVVIDGSLAGAGANGLVQLAASGSTFRGLVIQNFSGNGIVLGTGGGNLVAGNIIGLDYTGKISRPNGGDGIALSNTFYLESGIDTHLKWRLSLQGGLMYVFHTKFSGQDLGGMGFRLRVAMNW